MMRYQDLTAEPHFGHTVAEWISGGNFTDIALYEFHKTVDPTGIWNCEEGHEAFVTLSEPYYKYILGSVDHSPEVISVAVKLGGEWLICHDCGCNYYTGHGPQGILAMRKACVAKKASIISRHQDMEDWLVERFGPPGDSKASQARRSETVQFEKIVKSVQSFCADLPRRRVSFPMNYKEEEVRDLMLPMLNGVFQGRCNGEAMNGQGKTDILVRTKNGMNEHIFELKVWEGVQSLEKAIIQLRTYLTWNNAHAGILMLVREPGFTSILRKVDTHLAKIASIRSVQEHDERSFRFKLKYPTDADKVVDVHLELVPMS